MDKKTSKVRNEINIEFSIRELEKNEKNAMVFFGKVGLGISKENLQKSNYNTYDRFFLILDEEDNYNGETSFIKEHKCVIIRYFGGHEDAFKLYEKLMVFIKENNLEITGFSQEITLIDYGYSNDKSRFLTEIQIPISDSHITC